jgi:hypothetical protein
VQVADEPDPDAVQAYPSTHTSPAAHAAPAAIFALHVPLQAPDAPPSPEQKLVPEQSALLWQAPPDATVPERVARQSAGSASPIVAQVTLPYSERQAGASVESNVMRPADTADASSSHESDALRNVVHSAVVPP